MLARADVLRDDDGAKRNQRREHVRDIRLLEGADVLRENDGKQEGIWKKESEQRKESGMS